MAVCLGLTGLCLHDYHGRGLSEISNGTRGYGTPRTAGLVSFEIVGFPSEGKGMIWRMMKYKLLAGVVPAGLLIWFILTGLLADGRVLWFESARTPTMTPMALAMAVGPSDDAPDLRIISLDFDPELSGEGTCDGLDHRTLLMAVDNRGKNAQNDVLVTLRIRGSTDKDALISQSQTIASLASGEVKVLKFSGFTSLPTRDSYDLEIEVKPVPGERNVTDNRKLVTLCISKP